MDSSPVPSYFSYGETEPAKSFEPLHVQAIFSRIREQDWEIAPHRHPALCQLFLIEAGALEAQLETERVRLIGPCVLLIPMGKVHGFAYAQTVRGTMISVSDSFLRAALAQGVGPSPELRLDHIQMLTFAEEEGDFSLLRDLVAAVEREVSQRKPGYTQALGALLQLIVLQLGRHSHAEGSPLQSSEQARCFERFRERVSADLRAHRSVADYCAQLGVGERQLNRICRAQIGESPSAYIQRLLLEEAKRYLVHTAMPITSVGYELGFNDSAYFSRFFKKHTGQTPSAFAARHRL